MIGYIDIELNAERPQIPLTPLRAFKGSPSHVRIRNAPSAVAKWHLEKVYLTANYPDNVSRSVECVRAGTVWIGTLPGCNTVGTSTLGFKISADGKDEHGAAVTGYVLGKGKVEVLEDDGTVTVGSTTYYIHLLDARPSTPHKGDVAPSPTTAALELYNGTTWVPLGGGGSFDLHDVTLNLGGSQSDINDVLASIVRKGGGTVIE